MGKSPCYKNCNRNRTRRTRPYGMKRGLGWYCPMDRCYGPDYFKVNKKRARLVSKRAIQKELEETLP